jgi:hypothetical protein
MNDASSYKDPPALSRKLMVVKIKTENRESKKREMRNTYSPFPDQG